MSKIVAIGCIIVAVCIGFQQVDAIDFNPLDSFGFPIPNHLPKGINNIIARGNKRMQEFENDFEKNTAKIADMISVNWADQLQWLINAAEQVTNGLLNSNLTVCGKIGNDLVNIYAKEISIYQSCIVEEAKVIGIDLLNVSTSLTTWLKSLQKDLQEMPNCMGQPSSDPLKCIQKLFNKQYWSHMFNMVSNIFQTMYEISKAYPELGTCYITKHLNSDLQPYITGLNDTTECFQHLLSIFGM